MDSPTTYLQLTQYASQMRQAGLSETADLIDLEHRRLVERYGELEQLRVDPRLPWLHELFRMARLQKQRAEGGDQYGNVDRCTAVWCAITVGVVSRALNEGERLVPADVEAFTTKLKRDVEGVFQRIEGSRALEAGKARFLREQRWQQTKRAAVGEQKRQQQIGELIATKTRLEAALGQ